ncbi:MAG: hypothetical protein LBU19_00945 [Treponema sp.]|jgi:ABC-type multidrug transport system fused ATPase/permease subunit|nr:hypothetical protein [Treponema sp.]
MKWLNEMKTRFIYIGRMFRLLWGFDKAFLFILLGSIVIEGILPFVGMYLIKFSVDMLTAGADFYTYLPTVLILLGVELVGRSLSIHLAVQKDIHGNMSGNRLFSTLFRKTMELNYEMLLNKGVMEKRQMALKVFEGGRFNDLTWNFKVFAFNFITACGIVYIVARIEFWILFVVVAIVILNSIVTVKRARVNRDA